MKQTDRKFELFYKNLSNRGKFIRTIWLTILGILISVYALITVKDKWPLIMFVIIFSAMAIWQLTETYKKYKSDNSER